jgi:immunity protein, SdpI family
MHLNTVLAAEIGLALVVMGNYLPKVKSNWFVGVRTPWTLSSEASWRQTHRLAGWLFTLGGLLTFITALVRPDVAPAVMIGVLAASAGASVVYSYFAWKHDPERTA